MPRQTFGDFLNGDSSRGRGRGRGRGGARGGGNARGGGRGGVARGVPRGRGGASVRGGHWGADYSAMQLDYTKINAGGYSKMEYFNVQQHDAPSDRGRPNRGRGHMRIPRTPHAPRSGTATPITGGLGYHSSVQPTRTAARTARDGVTTWGGGGAPLFVKAGELFREGEVEVVKRDGDTLRVETYSLSDLTVPQMHHLTDDIEIDFRGDSHALHGQRASDPRSAALLEQLDRDIEAALHVDSSEAEVEEEVVVDEGDDTEQEEQEPVQAANDVASEDDHAAAVTTGAVPGSVEVQADTNDATEVAVVTILDENVNDQLPVPVGPDGIPDTIPDADPVAALLADSVGSTAPTASVTVVAATVPVATGSTPPTQEAQEALVVDEVNQTAAEVETDEGEDDGLNGLSEEDATALFFVDTAGSPVAADEPPADDALFFIDTLGDASSSRPVYDTTAAAPIGLEQASSRHSPDEEILFRPRTFADPVPTASTSRAPAASGFELTNVYVDPRVTLNRKDRKALKREKRSRNKRRRRRGAKGEPGAPRDDSDIDWGSDVDVPRILSVDELGHSLAHTDLETDKIDMDDMDDPEVDIEAMRRFGEGMARIGRDGDVMTMMESGSDEYSEIDEEVKGRARRRQNDPFVPKDKIPGEHDQEKQEDSDDDDEDDDDVTANFDALAAAYDSEEDGEDGSDDGDDDKLFTGKNGWKDTEEGEEDEDDDAGDDDEEDWFIKNMENAVDSGVMAANRKDRNRVFRAVASGTFDDEALPIAPAKKDKKGKHVPPELWDQWERDRQKKAEMKRERELQRLMATLDPYPGSRTGKGKSKLAGKSAAALQAHLIPASASEVAELFDVSSDDGGWGATLAGRKGRLALLPQSLDQIDAQIQAFLGDQGKTTLTLPPMDKEARKKIHMLAECYNIKSKSKGKGAGRFPILIKLARSGLEDEDKRDRLLAAAPLTGGRFYKALHSRAGTGNKASRGAAGSGPSTRAREGELVGEGAEKIGQDNIGHQLLSRMGWSEGSGIGRAGGLDAPIVAVVKYTKTGLGA